MKALEQAQSTNDYASQINILYMLGTHRAKDGSKQGAEEALEVTDTACVRMKQLLISNPCRFTIKPFDWPK